MEADIFCAFLILESMSTMLSRRIFDKCANYAERFVVKWELANFKVENVHLHQFISKSLRWRVKYFWAILIFGKISTMLWRRMFDKCANYVERFVIRSGYSEFSSWKMYP